MAVQTELAAVERRRKRKRSNGGGPRSRSSLHEKLPTEMLMEIISKLPTSSILQLSYKFPEFKPLIHDPYFDIIFQSNRETTTCTPPCTLLGFDYHNNEASLIEYLDENKTVQKYDLDDMMSCVSRDANEEGAILSSPEVFNSCNGWLLLRYIHKSCDGDGSEGLFETLRVVNPATRQCVVIFQREPVVDMGSKQPKYALGYSPKTRKYKVVKVVDDQEEHPSSSSSNSHYSFEVVDILGGNREKRVWRKMDFDYQGDYAPTNPVVLNGALHWLCSSNTVLRFDIDKEDFELIPTPYHKDFEMSTAFLAQSCGLLFLGAYKVMDFTKGLEIWVMKDYNDDDYSSNWVRVTVIEDFDPMAFLELVQVLDNGKMLFISRRENRLRIYDIEKRVWQDLVMRGMPKGKRTRMMVVPFVPSFLSL